MARSLTGTQRINSVREAASTVFSRVRLLTPEDRKQLADLGEPIAGASSDLIKSTQVPLDGCFIPDEVKNEHYQIASKEHAAEIDASLGLTVMHVRIDIAMAERLKKLAEHEGVHLNCLLRGAWLDILERKGF